MSILTEPDTRSHSALWYAWGHIDSGHAPAGFNSDHAFSFSHRTRAMARAYRQQRRYQMPSMQQAWARYARCESAAALVEDLRVVAVLHLGDFPSRDAATVHAMQLLRERSGREVVDDTPVDDGDGWSSLLVTYFDEPAHVVYIVDHP